MYCQRCHSTMSENDKFCVNCGLSIENSEQLENQVNNTNVDKTDTTIWYIFSILCCCVATLFFPPIVGGFGIFCGYKVYKTGRHVGGTILMIVNGVCITFGMTLGIIVAILSQ